MRPENWMNDLFGSPSRVRVLRVLARDVARSWTERELAKALGLSPNTVNLVSRGLRNQGILDFHRVGRSHSIRLRPDLKISQRLGEVFHQEEELWNDLKNAIMGAVPPGVACQLYGSAARGTASSSSDVDLLVVAESLDDAQQVAAGVRSAAAAVVPAGFEVVALDRATARRRRRSRFLQNVVREGQSLSTTKLEELL